MEKFNITSNIQTIFEEREEAKELDPKIKAKFAEIFFTWSPKDFVGQIYVLLERLPEDKRRNYLCMMDLPEISLDDEAFYNWLTEEHEL